MNILEKLETRFDPKIVFPDEMAREAYATIVALRHALKQSMIALDDWINVYAPEFCSENRVAEARRRVHEFGTIAYIADTQQINRNAMKFLDDEALRNTPT